MFLVSLMKPVILITLSNKTKKITTAIIKLIAHSSRQHHHLMKLTLIPFAFSNS